MSQIGSEAVMEAGVLADTAPSCLFGSRSLDFWLIGGLSILCWFPFYVFADNINSIDSFTYNISWVAFYLAYFINYPHFMASYKLAYGQGREFVTGNWFQLLLVPALLVLVIALGLLFGDTSFADSDIARGLNNTLAGLGIDSRVGRYSSSGSEMLAWLVMFMFFTVGWHYSKQAFGCMMVYAKFDNYRLGNLERNLIRYSLLSTWWITWLNLNTSATSFPYYGLTIHNLGLPRVLFDVSVGIVIVMYLLLLVMMVRKYLRDGSIPSATFLVPMVALLLWHVPLFSNPQYFYFIAMFHSLQYLPFVAKVEKTRYRRAGIASPLRGLAVFFALMLVLGYFSFDLIPNGLDKVTDSQVAWGFSYFLIAFLAFINIHHYFIDNVLWRFKTRQVRELLLG